MRDSIVIVICIAITAVAVMMQCPVRDVIVHPGGEWLIGGVIYLFYKLAEDVIQTKRKRD